MIEGYLDGEFIGVDESEVDSFMVSRGWPRENIWVISVIDTNFVSTALHSGSLQECGEFLSKVRL